MLMLRPITTRIGSSLVSFFQVGNASLGFQGRLVIHLGGKIGFDQKADWARAASASPLICGCE